MAAEEARSPGARRPSRGRRRCRGAGVRPRSPRPPPTASDPRPDRWPASTSRGPSGGRRPRGDRAAPAASARHRTAPGPGAGSASCRRASAAPSRRSPDRACPVENPFDAGRRGVAVRAVARRVEHQRADRPRRVDPVDGDAAAALEHRGERRRRPDRRPRPACRLGRSDQGGRGPAQRAVADQLAVDAQRPIGSPLCSAKKPALTAAIAWRRRAADSTVARP